MSGPCRSIGVIHRAAVIHNCRLQDWRGRRVSDSVAAVTQPTAVVLTSIGDRELSDAVDRVIAAVSARPVRVGTPNRRTWTAASAVVLDAPAAVRCAEAGLPRRDGVLLVGADPHPGLWTAAVDVGAQGVCALPAQEAELVRHLAEATDAGPAGVRTGRVISVVAGRGGAGASVLSAAVALAAGDCLLVDADPCGGGIDLLLGFEAIPGLRWPDVHGQGGRLSWPAVHAVLPRRRDLSILSGTRCFHDIDPGALTAVVDAGRRGGLTVVCDVPRQLGPAAVSALQCADLVAVVSSCDVRSVAATTVTTAVLRTLNPAIGLVVRGPSPGGLLAREAAVAAGLPLLAAMRPEPGLTRQLEQRGLRLRHRSPLGRAARQVLDAAHGGAAGGRAA